jgi:hypothetical protein
MDLNSILQSGEGVWALFGSLGASTVISIFTFLKVNVSGKKFNKLSDFAVVADQTTKFAKNELSSG